MIYGPPAAGKLTVAEALCETIGYRVLDNHLTADLALRVFTFGTKQHRALTEALRVELFRAAANERVDVISTFVYLAEDEAAVRRRIAVATKSGARVWLVRLCPSPDSLEQRVSGASRAARQKLNDVEQLRHHLRQNDVYGTLAGTDLTIDNTELAPGEVATQIRDAFGI